MDCVFGTGHCGAHGLFDLGEELFDGIKVRAVRGQEEELCPCLSDSATYRQAFVAAEIVEDDDVSRRQGPNEFLLDIGQKGIGVDRPVEDPWCIEPVVSEGCDKSHRSPMSVGDMGDQAFASFAPAPERSHIRLHPGFINEHEAIRIDLALMALPPFTLTGQLRPVLLGRQHGFF